MNGFRKLKLRLQSRTRRMRISSIAGWLVAVAVVCGGLTGCVQNRKGVEYIPADRAIAPLTKGQPAPGDGWFIPPAVLQELVPAADERFQNQTFQDLEGNDG